MAKQEKTTFVLEAPEATEVYLAGSFNDWDLQAHPLGKGEGDLWTTQLDLEPGEYEYLFVVDGEWWEDPASARRTPNPHGSPNSVLTV